MYVLLQNIKNQFHKIFHFYKKFAVQTYKRQFFILNFLEIFILETLNFQEKFHK